MRSYKFRAWDAEAEVMKSFDLYQTNNLPNYGYPVMQLTGLNDCNGNQIYEGDIVDATLYGEIVRKRQVIFDEGAFSVKHGKSYFPCLYELSDVEVIGNIYENPDLIN